MAKVIIKRIQIIRVQFTKSLNESFNISLVEIGPVSFFAANDFSKFKFSAAAKSAKETVYYKTAGGNDPWHGTAENCLSELVRNAEHVQQVSIQ